MSLSFFNGLMNWYQKARVPQMYLSLVRAETFYVGVDWFVWAGTLHMVLLGLCLSENE